MGNSKKPAPGKPGRKKPPAAPRNTGLPDLLWAAIRSGSKPTYMDLSKRFKINHSTVHQAVAGWIAAGFVAVEDGRAAANPAIVKRLVLVAEKDPGVVAPSVDRRGQLKPDTDQEKVWRAIQVMETFTHRDLEVIGLKGSTVMTYLKRLADAGYLSVTMRLRTNTYRRINAMMTGPRAPVVMVAQGGAIWDRNLGRIVKVEARNV